MNATAEADHSQPRVEGPLAERCAEHVDHSKQVAGPRGSFGVIGPRGHRREGGARSSVDTCQGAIETQASSMSPDIAIEEAKLKVTRLEKALEAMGDSSGAEVDCFTEGTRQCPRCSTGKSIGGANQRMPRIHQSGRASRREDGGRFSGRDDLVGGRPSTIESFGAADDGSSSSSPTESGGRVGRSHSEPLPSQRRREVQ